jgi:hypothetical protein
MIASAFLSCALFGVAQAGEPKEFYQDLRQKQALLPGIMLAGPFTSKYTFREDEGLRVTLPAKREKLFTMALQNRFVVPGDFEITGTYELLSADAPDDPKRPMAVVGVNIYIVQGDDQKRTARIGRFNTFQHGHAYEVAHTDRNPGGTHLQTRFPTKASSGQLRLVRQGTYLSYLVKGDGDETFEELHKVDFGTDDVTVVRFVVNTSEQPLAVDARLIDLRVRSGTLPAVAQMTTEDPPPAISSSHTWLITGAAMVVLVAAAGLLRVALKRRAPVSPSTAESDAAATLVVQCPRCQKRLKVAAGAVARKVKCPGCKAAFVPADQADPVE